MNKRQMKKFVKRKRGQYREKKNERFDYSLPSDLRVFSIDPQIIVRDYSIKHHYRFQIKIITIINWHKRTNRELCKYERRTYPCARKAFVFDKNINKIKGGEHIEYPSSLIINFSDHTAVTRGRRLTNAESSLVNIQDPVGGNMYMETVHNRKYEGATKAPESLMRR